MGFPQISFPAGTISPLAMLGTANPPSLERSKRGDASVLRQTSGCDTAEGTFSRSCDLDDDDDDAPANAKLLGIAFDSFMSFSLLQLFFAWLAHSHAMVGDSVAMIVDSIAYLFNWIAERRKREATACAAADDSITPRIRRRTQRKRVLELEIVPPILSVSILVVVTTIVTQSAVSVLLSPPSEASEATGQPNLIVMVVFSASNLCLDMLNVFCFSKSNENMGGDGGAAATVNETQQIMSNPSGYDRVHQDHKQHDAATNDDCLYCHQADDDEGEERHDEDNHANLNMCSAFTHVFADTVRSIAVIIAAAIAMISPAVDGITADAVAAVVVAVLILLSLIPLLHGLRKSASELQAIYSEEKSESMFVDIVGTSVPESSERTTLELT